MPVFQYQCRDSLGAVVAGTLEALDPDAATLQLRRDGLAVIELDEEDEGFWPRPIRRSEIIYVTTQLAVMVDTGITLSTALGNIQAQEKNPSLRRLLRELQSAVEGGEDFSAALARHPKLFDKTYLALVRASEATGTLGATLDRISLYLRKELETRSKIRGALAYPAVMLCVAVNVTIFMLTYILPKFAPLFDRRGMKLPLSTRCMMTVSKLLLQYWPFWIAAAVVAIAGLIYSRRTPRGLQAWDWVKIRAPLFGAMARKVAISRSIRTLGGMIGAGVPVLEAIRLCADVSSNYYYERLWLGVLDQVATGKRICEALAGTPLIPPMLIQMIATGEETGKLDKVLQRVSGFYDQEVEGALKTLTGMLEPIMITVMGIVVGGIAMSLLLPIFSLSRPAG